MQAAKATMWLIFVMVAEREAFFASASSLSSSSSSVAGELVRDWNDRSALKRRRSLAAQNSDSSSRFMCLVESPHGHNGLPVSQVPLRNWTAHHTGARLCLMQKSNVTKL